MRIFFIFPNSWWMFIHLLIACLLFTCKNNGDDRTPFSFDSIKASKTRSPEFLKTSDGTNLAFYSFVPDSPSGFMLFFHGGGAHSTAGYQALANSIRHRMNIAVYLMDLRGHGRSGGPRGFVSHRARIYKDIDEMLLFLMGRHPKTPMILAGHSSGAGLALNYTSHGSFSLDYFLFLAPELGYKSGTARKERNSFAEAHTAVFILNAISGRRVCNACDAVTFKYPRQIRQQDPLLLDGISPEMAHALTPEQPEIQFSSIRRPILILVGEDDEMIDPASLRKYMNSLDDEIRSQSTLRVVPEATHLSILEGHSWIEKINLLSPATD